MRKIHWVSRSADTKTGKIVVSYSPKNTCPDSCTLKDGGCYAWGLFYLRILGAKIDNGTASMRSLKDALGGRRADCKVVRHRIAGDVVGDVPGTIEECLEVERNNLTNIGYTHHWESDEAQPLKKWFRASCQNIEEVLKARKMGWATTLMVPIGVDKIFFLPNGEKAIKCPARHDVPNKKDITCNSCTLCKITDVTENKTVTFEVHGSPNTLRLASEKIT